MDRFVLMGGARHSSGLLLLVLAAVVGALLVWLPPTLISQYQAAAEFSPVWGYVYLATVGVGAVLLIAVSFWLVVRVWRNTRRGRHSRQRRQKDPSQLSAKEQEAELRENLAAGAEYAGGEEVSEEVRNAIREAVSTLEEKLETQSLELVAFGTISSGKSSLLNTLAGREIFRTDPQGGTTLTRNEIPWPGNDRVTLVDTPGLAEVEGERRAAESAAAAKDADLVLFVVDGPLKAYEVDLVRHLRQMEKRVLLCLNKEDWFDTEDRRRLIEQIREQVRGLIQDEDIVAVKARTTRRVRVRVLPDGSQAEEQIEESPDISPLAKRMMELVEGSGRDLLLANLLLQSRGLVEDAKTRVQAALDRQANELLGKYMWAAGGAAAINPIPLLDVAGGSAVTVKMVLDLARVYRQPIDIDTAVNLLSNLTKNLVAMLGVTAATPAITAMVASTIKTVPGVGTIAGGLVQGLVQALVTRWIGKVFIEYFRTGMAQSQAGLAELAREKWQEVTQTEQLLKLIQSGREHLKQKDA